MRRSLNIDRKMHVKKMGKGSQVFIIQIRLKTSMIRVVTIARD